MVGVTRRGAMAAGAVAAFRPGRARSAAPGGSPPPVGGEVDAGAVRFRYVSQIIERRGAQGLLAVENEVTNTGTGGLRFSWEKAGLVHFPGPLPAGGQARVWPSAPGESGRVDADAPLLFDADPSRADARACVSGPREPTKARPAAPRPGAPAAAAAGRALRPTASASTRIASSAERPGGGVVGFDARVEVAAEGPNVRYTAHLSPAPFSLALGGVVELLGDEGLAVRVAAEQGYKASVSSFDAMLPKDEAAPCDLAARSADPVGPVADHQSRTPRATDGSA